MMKTVLKWLAFVVLGALILWLLGQKALATEEAYMRQVVLKSSQDVAFLTARHAVDTLKQTESQIAGLARALIRENPSADRIHELLRIHFGAHPCVVGVRFFPNTTNPAEIAFRNAASGFGTDLLLPRKSPENIQSLLAHPSPPATTQNIKNESFAYLMLPVKELRENLYLGMIEAQVSMSRLFSPAQELASRRDGELLLLDGQGTIILPKDQGFSFEEDELKTIRDERYGGFIRKGAAQGEMVSFCTLNLLGTGPLPDMAVLSLGDPEIVKKFVERMRLNLGILMSFGLLLVMYLGRLVFFR